MEAEKEAQRLKEEAEREALEKAEAEKAALEKAAEIACGLIK